MTSTILFGEEFDQDPERAIPAAGIDRSCRVTTGCRIKRTSQASPMAAS